MAIFAWVLHEKSLEDNAWGIQVENAAKLVSDNALQSAAALRGFEKRAPKIHDYQGTTIFPIIFAALAGRSLKVVGRFMAAKGTMLGVRFASLLIAISG